MSLRVLLGLLVAAAVIMVPTINLALAHLFPPPELAIHIRSCEPGATPEDERGGCVRVNPDGSIDRVLHMGMGAGFGGDRFFMLQERRPGALPVPDAERGVTGGRAFAGPPLEFGAIRTHFLWINYASLGIVVLLAVVAFSFVVRWPIRDLLRSIEDIEHGAIPGPGGMSAPSELRQIGAALHRLAHRLRTGTQEREMMLAGMSHDLRSPLARIQAAIELRARPDEDWTPVLRDVREIDHIIGQCIDYVRDGQDEPTVPLALDELVRSVVQAPGESDVELDLDAARPLPLRRQSMLRAVRNLLDNAALHGAPPRRVVTRIDGGEIRLAVEDHGTGIEPAQWERLLKPFAQGARARQPGGAGLGLAIVQRVAQQHGGRLELRPAAAGQCFAIVLRLPFA